MAYLIASSDSLDSLHSSLATKIGSSALDAMFICLFDGLLFNKIYISSTKIRVLSDWGALFITFSLHILITVMFINQ